jgi:hypothetical protein
VVKTLTNMHASFIIGFKGYKLFLPMGRKCREKF